MRSKNYFTKWLRSHYVRKILGITNGTMQNMRINEDLPYNKVGGTTFYDMNEPQKND